MSIAQGRTRSLSILWICGSPIVGGAEQVTLQLAHLLAGRGHRISAIYPFGSALAAPLHRLGISGDATRLGGSLNLRAVGAIARALAAGRPDIALVTTADEWVWACFARRPPPTRLVLMRHMAIGLPRKVTWLANRRADAVIAVSDAVRASLSGRYGVTAARLHTIPNPVRFAIRAAPPASADRCNARIALGLPTATHWIGFLGGADPRKGIGDILRALALVRADLPDARLLLCGRGLRDPAARVAESLARAGLGNAVCNLGEVADVASVLCACDAIAMPTHAKLSEGLPLIVLEALACGTPVVAYATGGAVEALAGGSGLLARPDNPADLAQQLKRCLNTPGIAAALATRGLAHAREHYAPELAAARYESLFLRLCAQ